MPWGQREAQAQPDDYRGHQDVERLYDFDDF